VSCVLFFPTIKTVSDGEPAKERSGCLRVQRVFLCSRVFQLPFFTPFNPSLAPHLVCVTPGLFPCRQVLLRVCVTLLASSTFSGLRCNSAGAVTAGNQPGLQ
jgi:hypothetical protein